MTPPCSHHTSACRCGPRMPATADGHHSVVRVKGSAGLVKGELEVTSTESQESLVSTAIAILVLVTAAALAAVVVGVVGWLSRPSRCGDGTRGMRCPRLDLRRGYVRYLLAGRLEARDKRSR
jgi:hypothetical protein